MSADLILLIILSGGAVLSTWGVLYLDPRNAVRPGPRPWESDRARVATLEIQTGVSLSNETLAYLYEPVRCEGSTAPIAMSNRAARRECKLCGQWYGPQHRGQHKRTVSEDGRRDEYAGNLAHVVCAPCLYDTDPRDAHYEGRGGLTGGVGHAFLHPFAGDPGYAVGGWTSWTDRCAWYVIRNEPFDSFYHPGGVKYADDPLFNRDGFYCAWGRADTIEEAVAAANLAAAELPASDALVLLPDIPVPA